MNKSNTQPGCPSEHLFHYFFGETGYSLFQEIEQSINGEFVGISGSHVWMIFVEVLEEHLVAGHRNGAVLGFPSHPAASTAVTRPVDRWGIDGSVASGAGEVRSWFITNPI